MSIRARQRWINIVVIVALLISLVSVSVSARVAPKDVAIPVGQDLAEDDNPTDTIPQIKTSIARNQQTQKAATVVGETDPNGMQSAVYIVQLTGVFFGYLPG